MNDWFDHILYATRAQPEASAMLMEDRVITYGMLGDAIASSAQHVAALNLPPDSLLAVCIENPIRHMAVSLALFRMGIRAISIEPGHAITGLRYTLILGDPAVRTVFGFGAAFVEVAEDWFEAQQAPGLPSLKAQFAGEATIARHSLTSG